MSKIKTYEVIKLAAYYEKNLSDDQVKMYVEDLNLLSDEECALACKMYRSNPENGFFPRPMAKLVQLIRKPVSNEDTSQAVMSLLMAAVDKYGPHWTSGHFQGGETVFSGKGYAYRSWEDAARSVFGDVGLTVVNRYGGWLNFCNNIYESPDGVVRAQIKNLANSLHNIHDRTGSLEAPLLNSGGSVLSLSDRKNEQVNNLIEFMKKEISE